MQSDGIIKQHINKKLFNKALKEMVYLLPNQLKPKFEQFFEDKKDPINKSSTRETGSKVARAMKNCETTKFEMNLRSSVVVAKKNIILRNKNNKVSITTNSTEEKKTKVGLRVKNRYTIKLEMRLRSSTVVVKNSIVSKNTKDDITSRMTLRSSTYKM